MKVGKTQHVAPPRQADARPEKIPVKVIASRGTGNIRKTSAQASAIYNWRSQDFRTRCLGEKYGPLDHKGTGMTNIPTTLRIALGFIVALWVVGLTALAIGAPGEIVVATAAVGTVGAVIEWTCHRSGTSPTASPADDAPDCAALVQMRYETDPEQEFRRKH
jgi:hypothetical protein